MAKSCDRRLAFAALKKRRLALAFLRSSSITESKASVLFELVENVSRSKGGSDGLIRLLFGMILELLLSNGMSPGLTLLRLGFLLIEGNISPPIREGEREVQPRREMESLWKTDELLISDASVGSGV